MLPVLFSYYKILNYDDVFTSFITTPEAPGPIIDFTVYIKNIDNRIMYFNLLDSNTVTIGSYNKTHYFKTLKPYTVRIEQINE